MNALTDDPWTLLRRFQNDLNRLYEDPRLGHGTEGDTSHVVTSHWKPAVDIKEERERFVLKADVPGIDPKGIEITMEAGVLTIQGERKFDDPEERDNYKRMERHYGTFYRRFSLPDTADADKISATGKNGVLEIAIPKKTKAQPRKITVSG